MAEYRPVNIIQMLERRQLGLPLKEKGRCVRHSRNNYRCDFDLLKTLLCDRELYLEVIACRKVSRSKEPSFCHNRLFTNNYCSWFNLCTSPTAGPFLMKSNIFSKDMPPTQISSSSNGPKIVDAVTVNPPNGCMPLPNSQHLPCILLLGKNGWLYQYCLKDAALLNKIYIHTNVFSDELVESSCSIEQTYENQNSPTERTRQIVSSLNITYKYITLNGAEGRVLVRSGTVVQNGYAYSAYLLLALFPLKIVSHFVTKAINPNLKAELWTDIFVITAIKGSSVTLYGFKDIEKLYHINASPVYIGKKVFCQRSPNHNEMQMVEIGDTDIGIPYTTELIDLNKFEEYSSIELFHTKALKHIFRVGGVPYHYIVPVDNSCTSWSLRSILDKKEIAKFHVDEKWDKSHVAGVDFHSDESGRLLLVNNNTVTVYKIEEERHAKQRMAICSPDRTVYSHRQQQKCSPTQLLNTSSISEPDFQLRVIGSPCKHTVANVKRQKLSKHKTTKCYEIDVSHKKSADIPEETEKWIYPSQTPNLENGQSSYGRTLRQTRRFVGYNQTESVIGIQCVSYEDELDVLAVLHFRGITSSEYYSFGNKHYDLVVSLYDNATGARINTVTLEQDLVPSDNCEASIILDEDTVIYTRTEMNDTSNYKIMRFCRKY
ncbi:DDB1- and CUL4-associated factor 17-like [Styela clava]